MKQCCGAPRLVRAWVPFRPFGRSWFCQTCLEVMSDMNPVVEWLWSLCIAPLWNGRIEIEEP